MRRATRDAEPADEIRRARPRRDAPSADDHRAADRAAAGRHEPAQGDRETAGRQLPSRRSLRLVRVVDAHHGARLQSEPHGLHARRRAARRHDLRQPQRPAHQPRDSDRARRARRAVAGHRLARHGVDEQSRRRDRVLLRRLRRASSASTRRRRSAATQRAARSSTSTRGELGDAARGCASPRRDTSTEKWKGGGDQDVAMYNFKLVQPVGDGELTVLLQLLRSRRDRLSGSVEGHRRAPRQRLGQLVPGLVRGGRRRGGVQRERAERRHRLRRRVLERVGPAQGRPRLRRARPAVRRLAGVDGDGLRASQRRPGTLGHAVHADARRRAALDPHDGVRPRARRHRDGAHVDAATTTRSTAASGTRPTTSCRRAASTASRRASGRHARSRTFRRIRC